jgi:hypothetical protein
VDQLVYHRGCRCMEGWWTWDGGEREWRRWMDLRWRDALAREEAKWRHSWVMWRVAKVEMTCLYQWRVGVELSEECGRRRWCRFNASVSTWEERWCDKSLTEDEAKTVSSSWLHGKEAWHGATTSTGVEAAAGREKGADNVSWADENLIGQKNKENPRARFNCNNCTVKI